MQKLYLTIEEAGEWSGLGARRLREMVNSANPPPLMRSGRKVLLQAATLPAYLERVQDVRLNEVKVYD